MDAQWVPIISAAISGTIAIGGVAFANRLTLERESRKSEEERRKEATFLAILVAAHLDRYVARCGEVSRDDGTDEYGEPNGRDGVHEVAVEPPTFDPLALEEVDWKSLPSDLMYKILDIPYRAEQAERRSNHAWSEDDFPHFTPYFEARRLEYARLGIEVAATTKALRKQAGLQPRKDGNRVIDAEVDLREQIDWIESNIAERKQRRELAMAKRRAERAQQDAGAASAAQSETIS